MSDTAAAVALAPPAAGHRLAALCADLARALNGLLSTLETAAESPLRESCEFLAAMGGDTTSVAPPGSGEDGLDRLVSTLELSPAETDMLLLAGMSDEHEGYAGVFRQLNPRAEPWPTVGLAARLFCNSAEERRLLRSLVEDGRAVSAGVLEIDAESPLFERSLRVPEALWSALAGVDVWPLHADVRRDESRTEGLEEWLDGPAARCARSALASGERCTIAVTADSEIVSLHRARALVAATGARAVTVVPPAARDPRLERLLLVHAAARGVVAVIGLATPGDPGTSRVVPSFDDWPAPVVLAGRTGAFDLRGLRPVLVVPAEPGGSRDRRAMWRAFLPSLADHAEELAAKSAVEPFMAAEVATDLALLGRHTAKAPDVSDAVDALRTRAGMALSSGAKLIRPRASWEQLVLPADALAQLRESVDRLKHQPRVLDDWGFLAGRTGSRGVRMLFAGPPGTGKTLSAEILAGALSADLLVVEISQIVSKWIGETEKHLAEVFDAAERSHAVLLFDEADALFGKRTEVSDAHDRYANLETAYLLMRLERYEGLAVLATNLRQNVDPAFTRRLEFIVEFTEPGPAERALLWRGHLPPAAPLADDVDLAELAAHYPVVGGVIRNASVAAGFLAAADGGLITRDHLIRSLRREYEKHGRAFPAPHIRLPST